MLRIFIRRRRRRRVPSSDPAVAKVDGQGLVSGLSTGEALITVTAKMTMNYNKAQVTIPVRVCSGAKDIAGCTGVMEDCYGLFALRPLPLP